MGRTGPGRPEESGVLEQKPIYKTVEPPKGLSLAQFQQKYGFVPQGLPTDTIITKVSRSFVPEELPPGFLSVPARGGYRYQLEYVRGSDYGQVLTGYEVTTGWQVPTVTVQPQYVERPLPGGVRQLVMREAAEAYEREVNEALARMGWVPEKVTKLFEQKTQPQVTDPFTRRLLGLESLSDLWTPPELKGAEKDVSGRAYAWTMWDIYNIAVYSLTAVSAGLAVKGAVERIRISQQLNRYETIRKELFGTEEPSFIQSPTKEFWQQTQQPLETSPFQPAEQWYRITRGTPTTPMSKTLEQALYQNLSKGGISATQELLPSTWTMPPALETVRMAPKVMPTRAPSYTDFLAIFLGATTLLEQPTKPSRLETQITRPQLKIEPFQVQLPTQRELLGQTQLLEQEAEQIQRQQQAQAQIQIQKQIQLMGMPSPPQTTLTFQPPPFFDDFLEQRRGRRKRGLVSDLIGRYGRINPIMEAQKVWKVWKKRFM